MITQNANNKVDGTVGVQCDFGIPVMGRDPSNNTYKFLNTNSAGVLNIINNSKTFATGVKTSATPASNLNPITGVKAANLVLSYNQISATALVAGLYQINPFFICNASVAGAVNFTIIKAGTPLATYAASRIPFTDPYAPAITDFSQGYGFFWHQIVNQPMGNNNFVSYNVQSQKTVYLEAGTYFLLITVDTSITMNAGENFSGFYEFTQL